jgi:hypothetical protein
MVNTLNHTEVTPPSNNPERHADKAGLVQKVGRTTMNVLRKLHLAKENGASAEQTTKTEKRVGGATIATGAGSALLAVALALGPNVSAAPTERPGTTQETTGPSAEPTPTSVETAPPVETAPNVFLRTEMPAELQRYADMTIAEFAGLSNEEQWTYASYLAQYRAAFEARFYAVSGIPSDKPNVLNANSTAIDLIRDRSYSYRMAQSFTTNGEYTTDSANAALIVGELDLDDATKLILAASRDSATYERAMSELDPRAINVDTLAIASAYDTSVITIISEERDGNTITATYTDGTQTLRCSWILVEYTAYDGTTQYNSTGGTYTIVG